jgi:methionine biosynthesis protein MetW
MTTPRAIRIDLQIIADLIPQAGRVLDLGCGDGDLLHKLIKEKQIQGHGVELHNEHIYQCIAKGVPVVQGNLDEGLSDYQNGSFDYVILSRTLQEVHKPVVILREMVRVGRIGIISFPNFGYWRTRLQLFFQGRMPVTKTLPHQWYDTPNIHLVTVKDFKIMCGKENIRIVNQINLTAGRQRALGKLWPNAFAELVVFVLEKK